MKITVNGKKHEMGKALGRDSCKVGFERLAMLSGVDLNKVELVTFKHKSGESGVLSAGNKVIAHEGSAFTVTAQEPANAETVN